MCKACCRKLTNRTRLARIEIAGHVDGAAAGVATEIELKGHWTFDLDARLVRDLRLTIKEKRAMGHVGPGLDVTSQFGVRYAPIKEPKLLKEADWQGITPNTRPGVELLSFRSRIAGYHFHHGRDWHILDERPNILVLRLVQRGELVAQANISPLPPAAEEKRLDLDAFQKEVEKALGENFGEVIAASESRNPAGQRVFRVVVQGEVNSLSIQWNYYLVSDDEGHQLSLVFTFERNLAKRFQHADKVIVDSLRIEPDQTKEADKSPSPVVGRASGREAAASPRR